MKKSLIKFAGFALLFALGILIGNRTVTGQIGLQKTIGQCTASQNCSALKQQNTTNPPCNSAVCDFTNAGGI